MLIYPETGAATTLKLAEKLRKAAEQQHFTTAGHQTVCFGVATCREGDKADDIVRRADDALYDAKREAEIRWSAYHQP